MSHSMSGMSGMSGMDDSSASECSMNMLGNWETIGTCVLTSSWHIKTEAQFAGTCIGVFLIVFTIETVRRWSREFDRWILERAAVERRQTRKRDQELKSQIADKLVASQEGLDMATSRQRIAHLENIFFGTPISSSTCRQAAFSSMRFRPKMWQQLLRSLLYGVQFTGAYLVMLIAMTFNGYIIIAIIFGGIFGHFFSTWDTMGSSHMVDFDDLDHGYSSESEKVDAPARRLPCCEKGGKTHEGSMSSSTDELNIAKRQVVTLPEHGYGSGACCI